MILISYRSLIFRISIFWKTNLEYLSIPTRIILKILYFRHGESERNDLFLEFSYKTLRNLICFSQIHRNFVIKCHKPVSSYLFFFSPDRDILFISGIENRVTYLILNYISFECFKNFLNVVAPDFPFLFHIFPRTSGSLKVLVLLWFLLRVKFCSR